MTQEQLEIARNQMVVKSNNLIQKTRYTLSVQQQKIILYLISKIKPIDEDLIEYEFDLLDLCDLCGIEHHGQNYKNFKDSIQKLHDSSFWIETETEDILISWVNFVRINRQTNTVQLRLDPKLKPFLLQLKEQFTAYELGSVIQMKSKYSLRIYELLKSYSSLGVAKFDIKYFREKLDIISVYSDYRDLRRYVIDKSVKEINQYTDLNINFYPIKHGRSVTDLVFQISGKNEADLARLRLARELSLKKGKV